MNFDQLNYFITVCDNRSINLASKELHISQQGLSISINNLEQEVGAKLLVRTNRGVFPTDTGKKVYNYAKRTIHNWIEIVNEVQNINHSNIQGSIIHRSTINYLRTLLPSFSVDILTNFPKLEVQGKIDTFDNIIQGLLNKSIDYAFINLAYIDSPDEIPLPKNLLFTPLFDCKFYVWLSDASPLAKKCALTFEDIKNKNIALQSGADFFLYKSIFKQKYDMLLKNISIYNYSEIISKLVEQNIAITFDVKMNRYGMCSEIFFKEKAVTHVPLLLEESHCQIYGGYLVHKDTDKLPLIKSLTANI